MQIRRIDSGQAPSLPRGGLAVIVSTGAGGVPCLADLLEGIPGDVPVILLGGSPEAFEVRRELWWAGDGSGGRERALDALAPADVVLLHGDCRLGTGWLGRLRDAALAGADTATASALVGVDGADAGGAAEAVARDALRLRPRLAAPVGPCRYVRRQALELAGPMDDGFAVRCVAMGLAHVLADDVLAAASSEVEQPEAPGAPNTQLSRAVAAARRALHGLSVTIDARELRGPVSGWHVAAVELIGALAASRQARLTVIVGEEPSAEALEALSRLRSLRIVRTPADAEKADIVHRPFQISVPSDLAVLAGLGERLVITHHDLIGYHNPAYFRDRDAWLGYRELTGAALALADHVVFDSALVREDALAEGLLEPARASVVHLGVDHTVLPAPASRRPHGLTGEEPFLLCLGSDLLHKNRVFALRLLCELRGRGGWDGRLVFAGPVARHGSSREDERRFLAGHPELASAVVDCGPVSEAEKLWLLEQATLVLYPTVQEGFGLLPFEAAQHGTPCLWSAGSALSELLPVALARIVRWDAAASAAAARELIDDAAARTAHVKAVCAAAAELRWERTAAALLELYRRTAEVPPNPAGVRERAHGLMRRGISEDAMRLVGPDGVLPADIERPLLALAAHRRLAAPVFGALRAGYALARRRGRL